MIQNLPGDVDKFSGSSEPADVSSVDNTAVHLVCIIVLMAVINHALIILEALLEAPTMIKVPKLHVATEQKSNLSEVFKRGIRPWKAISFRVSHILRSIFPLPQKCSASAIAPNHWIPLESHTRHAKLMKIVRNKWFPAKWILTVRTEHFNVLVKKNIGDKYETSTRLGIHGHNEVWILLWKLFLIKISVIYILKYKWELG